MIFITPSDFKKYVDSGQDEKMLRLFRDSYPDMQWDRFDSQCWHLESPEKRYIFNLMYSELIKNRRTRSLLDVGGGITSMTAKMCGGTLSPYVLVDPSIKKDSIAKHTKLTSAPNFILVAKDWKEFDLEDETFDIVLANDLFPNVDQRLEMFIDKFLPKCKEMRLSLTFYNNNRYYVTKRVDAEEQLTVLMWDSDHLLSVLKKYQYGRFDLEGCDDFNEHAHVLGFETAFNVLSNEVESIFKNGRKVVIVRLIGGQAKKNVV